MKNVLLIGKYGEGQNISDGGSLKVRLYKECLEQNGVQVTLLDLYNWKKKIIRSLLYLKKQIKNNDCILIMGGPNGSRKLIPLVNRFNRRYHKRTVYCPLGIGTIENIIKDLDSKSVNEFINCQNFFDIRDDKMANSLSKLSLIIPQNDTLTTLYKTFYKLDNVETVLNFRNVLIEPRKYILHKPFKIIFLSRIAENKGIFLLMEAVSKIDDVILDIYGEKQLTEDEQLSFDSMINSNDRINYNGICDFDKCIYLLKEYDLFCLPTKYVGEGTSGAFIESLIAGTPTLLSSYSQAKELVKDGKNGFLFEINSLNDLINKITIIKNSDISSISAESQKLAKRYVFEYNKDDFLKSILG